VLAGSSHSSISSSAVPTSSGVKFPAFSRILKTPLRSAATIGLIVRFIDVPATY